MWRCAWRSARDAVASPARSSRKACFSAASAGSSGLFVAYLGSHTILSLAFPDARNMPIDANPSAAILGFAFLVSLLTGALFGTAPAWMASHAQPAEALRGVNRSTRDRSSFPQKALVVFQAALSLVLLAGAILMTQTLVNLEHQNFGVATANRYVLHFDPAGAGYTMERLPALYRQIEDRFSALPGVASVSLAMYSPLEGDNWGECVIPQGHPAPRPGDRCGSSWDRVSIHFLDSVGVPIVRGRNFTDQDTPGSPAGCAREPGVCEALLSQSGSHRPALRHRPSQVLRQLGDRRCFRGLQTQQSARRCASRLSAAAYAAVPRLHRADDDIDRSAVDVHELP